MSATFYTKRNINFFMVSLKFLDHFRNTIDFFDTLCYAHNIRYTLKTTIEVRL